MQLYQITTYFLKRRKKCRNKLKSIFRKIFLCYESETESCRRRCVAQNNLRRSTSVRPLPSCKNFQKSTKNKKHTKAQRNGERKGEGGMKNEATLLRLRTYKSIRRTTIKAKRNPFKVASKRSIEACEHRRNGKQQKKKNKK